MNTISAIFSKQVQDFMKNAVVAGLFISLPLMTFLFVMFVPLEEGISNFALVGQMTTMAIGLPLMAITTSIGEDIETKSLRFLVMAGVKPLQYLVGILAFFLILSVVTLATYAFMGELYGQALLIFTGFTLLGLITSAVFGGVLGLLSKSSQQAQTYGTIGMMSLGMIPMLVRFGDGIAFTRFLFTQQIDLAFMYLGFGGGTEIMEELATYAYFSWTGAVGIIIANLIVALVLFFVIYRKKGTSLAQA